MPALLGFQALLGLLVKLLEWIIGKFAKHMTVRIAASLAYVTLYIAMLGALAAVVAGILAGISSAMPAELAMGFKQVKPDNFEVCVSAIYSTKVAIWVYQHKRNLLEWEQMRRYL